MSTNNVHGKSMDIDVVQQYLAIARQHYTQQQIADHLGIKDARTIRRWETNESKPKPYVVHALRQLIMPFGEPDTANTDFSFIDLFAGIGGIRAAFESIGGLCVYTSEWDSYAQKTYVQNGVKNFPGSWGKER